MNLNLTSFSAIKFILGFTFNILPIERSVTVCINDYRDDPKRPGWKVLTRIGVKTRKVRLGTLLILYGTDSFHQEDNGEFVVHDYRLDRVISCLGYFK